MKLKRAIVRMRGKIEHMACSSCCVSVSCGPSFLLFHCSIVNTGSDNQIRCLFLEMPFKTLHAFHFNRKRTTSLAYNEVVKKQAAATLHVVHPYTSYTNDGLHRHFARNCSTTDGEGEA